MFTALVTCAAISSMVARDTTSPALVAAALVAAAVFAFLASITQFLHLSVPPSPFSDGDSRGAVDVEGGRAGAIPISIRLYQYEPDYRQSIIDVIDGSRRIASNISETVISLASASPLVKGLPKLASSLGRLFELGSRENDLVVCNFQLDRLLNPVPLPAARNERPPLAPIFSSPSPPHPDFNPREASREPAMRKRRFDLDDQRDVDPVEELSRLAKKLRNTTIEPTSQSPVMVNEDGPIGTSRRSRAMVYSNKKPSTQARANRNRRINKMMSFESICHPPPTLEANFGNLKLEPEEDTPIFMVNLAPIFPVSRSIPVKAPRGQAPKSIMLDPYSGARERRRARDKRVSKDKKTAKAVPTLEQLSASDVKRSSVRHKQHHAAAQESLCDDHMDVEPSFDYYNINLEYIRQLQDDIGPRSDDVVNFDCINHPHVNSLGLVFLDDMSEAIESIEYNNALVCELGVRPDEDTVI
ncbi:hypothetical protein RQP46_003747 [Phenoliferia psychrophenolica]